MKMLGIENGKFSVNAAFLTLALQEWFEKHSKPGACPEISDVKPMENGDFELIVTPGKYL